MDTFKDIVPEAKDYYDISDEEFFQWLISEGKTDTPEWFLKSVIGLNDQRVIKILKEKYWDEFMECVEFAEEAKHEKEKTFQGSV